MKARDLIKVLETLANPALQESWDNSGYLLGNDEKEVKTILIALDLTDEILEMAIQQNVDFIITHHPLLFKPIKNIVTSDFIGRRIIKCIQHGIGYYAMHTSFDVAVMGQLAAEQLELSQLSILDQTYEESCFKIAVYVPEDYAERVRDAMTSAGAGHIGNYSHCTYNIKGEGTFWPLKGTTPFLGAVDKLEKVKEIKIETIVPNSLREIVIKEMKSAHPYEEVAYDVYKIEEYIHKAGAGRVGYLPQQISLIDFCKNIKEVFGLEILRLYGDETRTVEKVAVLPGSGGNYINQALRAGAEVFLTGDISHHDGIDANARGLAVIDAGHYGLEKIFIGYLENYLKQQIPDIHIIKEEVRNPFVTV